MGETMKKMFSLVTVALFVAVDQLIKIIIDLWLKPIHSFTLIPGVVSFTYVENRGVAFGMLQNQRWFFTTVTAAVIIAGLYFLIADKIKSNYLLVCTILVLAGGIGNLIDRIFRTYVIDFIEPLFINFAVFNFADILVSIGACMIIGWLLYGGICDAKKEKAEKAAKASEAAKKDE